MSDGNTRRVASVEMISEEEHRDLPGLSEIDPAFNQMDPFYNAEMGRRQPEEPHATVDRHAQAAELTWSVDEGVALIALDGTYLNPGDPYGRLSLGELFDLARRHEAAKLAERGKLSLDPLPWVNAYDFLERSEQGGSNRDFSPRLGYAQKPSDYGLDC